MFLKPENGEKLAQKILEKNSKQWGIYSPNTTLAVRVICQSDRPSVDRPVDRQRSKIRPLEPPVDRAVDRNKQRALLSVPVDRPVDRPTVSARRAQAVHVGRPFGRLATGSVDRAVDRQSLSGTEQGQTHI